MSQPFCRVLTTICAITLLLLIAPQLTFAQSGVDDPNGNFQMEGDAQTTPNPICFLTFANGGPAIATPTTGNGVDANGCPTVNPAGAAATWNLVTYAGTTDDWSSFAFSGVHFTNKAHSLFVPSFVTDGINAKESSFLGTSSKDTDDITAWTWNASHTVQAKDDIEHAYAGAYKFTTGARTGDTMIIAGMDRFSNAGDATAGFWFLQDSTFAMCVSAGHDTNGLNPACTAGGTFVGQHFDGDMLIVSDFSQGGAVSTINIFVWQSGGLVLDKSRSPAPCDIVSDSNDLCGAVNNSFTQTQVTKGGKTTTTLSAATVPTGGWTFGDSKGSSAFLTGEFLEIAVDLNTIFPGGNVPCFSNFFAETRSSTSSSASLSDLTPPVSFPLCSLSPTKSCTSSSIVTLSGATCQTNEVCDGRQAIRYNFGGSVQNTGSSTIFHANLKDTPPTAAQGYIANSLTIDGASATPGTAVDLANTDNGILSNQSAAWSGTLDTSAILGKGALNSISVTASSNSSGSPQNVDGTADWGDPSSCGPTITTGLTVAKQCETCLVGNSDLHVHVVEGVKVCNTGNTTVTNLVAHDCRGVFSGTPGGSPGPSCSTGFITLTLTSTTLAAGACETINVGFDPTSTSACSSGNCTYTDTVYAEGDAAFSGHEFATPANTSCSICPINTSCPTIVIP